MSTNPYSSPTAVPTQSTAQAKLYLPAIFLLITSLLGVAFMMLGGGFWAVRLYLGDLTRSEEMLAYRVITFASVNGCVSLLVLIGAISMLRLKPRWAALAGAWAALIPLFGPCYVLSIPFGMWALIVLFKPEVIATFQSNAEKAR
jgi:hypothetical protein